MRLDVLFCMPGRIDGLFDVVVLMGAKPASSSCFRFLSIGFLWGRGVGSVGAVNTFFEAASG